ncbi:MAG: CsbD family protein [Acidimicrobiales bacterium]
MSGNTDDIKGRAKEAAGDLTNDKDLKNEGKMDRAAGAIKDKVDDVKDAAQDAMDRDRR